MPPAPSPSSPIHDLEAETSEDEAEDDGWAGTPEDDAETAERVRALARQTTRARIGRGTARRPLIISAQPEASHVCMSEVGSQAALGLAAALAGVAGLMLWVRFG